MDWGEISKRGTGKLEHVLGQQEARAEKRQEENYEVMVSWKVREESIREGNSDQQGEMLPNGQEMLRLRSLPWR